MSGIYRAVLIGANNCPSETELRPLDYAEADAQALFTVLTDPDTGMFERPNVTLLKGADATATSVKKALRYAARDSGLTDFLFVYFAGHGVMDSEGTPFLGTRDFDSVALGANPDEGLRMSFLRKDVFDYAQGSSLLVLDCCEAGAYLGETAREAEALAEHGTFLRSTLAHYTNQITRHCAILACQEGREARESSRLRHGVFTAHLLDMLGATDRGGITIKKVVAGLAALDERIGYSPQGWEQDILLARPRVGPAPVSPAAPNTEIVPLAHPMKPLMGTLPGLLRSLFRDESTRIFRCDDRLDRLAVALQAKAAAIVDLCLTDQPGWSKSSESFRSTYNTGTFDEQELLRSLSNQVLAVDRGALAHVWSGTDTQVLAVPLRYLPDRHVSTLLIFAPPAALLDMGELLGHLLAAGLREAPDQDPSLAELNVVTQLRAEFGRLPHDFYLECLQLYKNHLESVIMAFEPIVEIGPTAANVSIYGWEALARTHADATRAPADILRAAEVWGSEFIVERDSVLARKAIRSYRDAIDMTADQQIRPLSINVAVPALMSDVYAAELRKALDEAKLGKNRVTLEISERDPIAPQPDVDWNAPPLEFFQKRLGFLAREHGIAFAIDDFGVGYASLDRIATLSIAHIKVDRAVLTHPLAVKELKLVVDVAEEIVGFGPSGRTVIIEGYDEEIELPLSAIYAAGVHHVQGYIVGRPASQDLRPLSADVRETIAGLVAGAPSPRPQPEIEQNAARR